MAARCSPFISKLKAGGILITGKYTNYQAFRNLQFRALLTISFRSIQHDLRDTSSGKTPFVSVGITRLVLFFRETSDIHFLTKRRYKMMASGQVEIPSYRGIGRQRGRGFGALAKLNGRTAVPFLRKYIVPAAKRVVADMLEYAAPETADVFSGRRNFKTAAKSVGIHTLG